MPTSRPATIPPIHHLTRRHFLQGSAAAGGLAAFGGSRPFNRTEPLPALTPDTKVEALVLTCLDYRFLETIAAYLDSRGLTNNYDHVILAGASLGAQTEAYPAWTETWWQHLDLAIQLHQISRVFVLDHRDCGAFRLLIGPEYTLDRESETAAHTRSLRSLRDQINERKPDLAVELMLIDLDRSIEVIDE